MLHIIKQKHSIDWFTAALLFWHLTAGMCFPLLDNVSLMKWTVSLWWIPRNIWLSQSHALKEISAAQL